MLLEQNYDDHFIFLYNSMPPLCKSQLQAKILSKGSELDVRVPISLFSKCFNHHLQYHRPCLCCHPFYHYYCLCFVYWQLLLFLQSYQLLKCSKTKFNFMPIFFIYLPCFLLTCEYYFLQELFNFEKYPLSPFSHFHYSLLKFQGSLQFQYFYFIDHLHLHYLYYLFQLHQLHPLTFILKIMLLLCCSLCCFQNQLFMMALSTKESKQKVDRVLFDGWVDELNQEFEATNFNLTYLMQKYWKAKFDFMLIIFIYFSYFLFILYHYFVQEQFYFMNYCISCYYVTFFHFHYSFVQFQHFYFLPILQHLFQRLKVWSQSQFEVFNLVEINFDLIILKEQQLYCQQFLMNSIYSEYLHFNWLNYLVLLYLFPLAFLLKLKTIS